MASGNYYNADTPKFRGYSYRVPRMSKFGVPHSPGRLTVVMKQLFIPAAQIYGVSDTIPFHVQLTAPSSSLLAFLPSYSDATSSASPDTSPIRVFLLRQVLVEVRGQKGWRNCELGNGNLWALPPVAANAIGENDESLDWEGEVRCRADTTIGGFNIGNLVVKVIFYSNTTFNWIYSCAGIIFYRTSSY
jgi:hypothetical protein